MKGALIEICQNHPVSACSKKAAARQTTNFLEKLVRSSGIALWPYIQTE